jgi:endoglucanase
MASSQLLATGNGLKADYFDNIDFTNLKLTRTDTALNFNWGTGSPAASIAADTFSVRWTGQVLTQAAGEYTFYTTADDGIRLSVNGRQIINNYVDQAPTTKTGKITLAANQKYDIKVEYYERGGGAVAKLEWAGGGLGRQVIPTQNLFSTTTITPPPTPKTFNYTEALQKSLYFYDAQKSGDLPDNFRVEWRGDSALKDGLDVGKDLAGGWYDAGDRIKFSRTIAYTVAMLAWGYLKTPDVYQASGQQSFLLDNVKWATDYLLKAFTNSNAGSYEFYTQVGSMGSGSRDDHQNWVAAEVIDQVTDRPSYKINTATPDSSIAGTTAAAFASASVLFRQTGNAAYADLLLDKAEKMFDFADRYRGINQQLKPDGKMDVKDGLNTSTPYTDVSFYDELLWGSTWVHQAKVAQNNAYGNQYLTRAEAIYNDPGAGAIRGNFVDPHSWQSVDKGAKVILAELTGKAVYKTEIQNYLDYWTVGYNNRRIQYTPAGLAWQSEWGALRYATTQGFVALVYGDQVTDAGLKQRYTDFARGQINYALGDNPYQRSYVLGFGSNPMQSVHHSTAFGRADGWDSFKPGIKPRHLLYGALLGGPDVQDKFTEDVTNYVTNEVSIDYNAGYMGALARLSKLYGGSVVNNFVVPEVRTDQYFVESAVDVSGSNFVEIRAQVNNQSSWPAKFSDRLSFRYYFTLDNGVDPTKLQLTINSTQPQVKGSIRQYSGNIYFAEIDLTGVRIFPGGNDPQNNYQLHYRKDLTFRITSPVAWNSSNDWSYGSIAPSGTPIKASKITLYENGVLRYGQVPV